MTVPGSSIDLGPKPPPQQYTRIRQIRDDLAIRRETMRGWIALILVAAVVLSVLGAFVLVGTGRLPGEVLVQGVIPSLVGLAGTAIGYYFGSQERSGGQSQQSYTGRKTPWHPLKKSFTGGLRPLKGWLTSTA